MICCLASVWRRSLFVAGLVAATFVSAAEPKTERLYLSGHGPKDAVPWAFTVTGGRRAGEPATIPVPSNWELHGFGAYNYGQQKIKGNEHGLYRTEFAVPSDWKGRRVWLVFEGVMTDATVKVNGQSAGPVHEGGFYRFRYDVTKLVKYGPERANVLEVDVAKVSGNRDTEGAERTGDYWVFGGIFRPVWIEATPTQAIDQVAIDARADGSLSVHLSFSMVRDATRVTGEVLDDAGRRLGEPFMTALPRGGTGSTWLNARFIEPKRWTAETPNLYTLRLTLSKGDEPVHVVEQRFGFRTFEVRDGEGLFVNGQRVLLKGVNRHSFRPETGRALNPEDCYDDARLIRELNMNAVRMSHYPPDEAFLDACDELGLYVLDELSGWHHAHDTANGRRLVREMVDRDVNHPCIVFWDNGNEGGNNRDLDGEFARYDPQDRRVLHPWELFDGVNTKHYPNYDDLAALLHGADVVMPTEFLHGMYDGGAGAGLEDYWRAIASSPVGGGGFIWDFADEGVVRTDQGGRVDVFSTFAPDGIVGPHHEKEGSFYAVRDIWNPVQIDRPHLDDAFDGTLVVHNDYDFTSLRQCRFTWELRRFNGFAESPVEAQQTVARGEIASPTIAPHAEGRLPLKLPSDWRTADALAVTAFSPTGDALWSWSWPTPGRSSQLAQRRAPAPAEATPAVEKAGSETRLRAGDLVVSFGANDGMLRRVERGGKTYALSAGPRLVFARPGTDAQPAWLPFTAAAAGAGTYQLPAPSIANVIELEVDDLHGADALSGAKLELSADGSHWHTIFDATRRPQDGGRYEFPPQMVAAVRLSNLYRYDGRPPVLKSFRVGYAAARFPAVIRTPARVRTGVALDANTHAPVAWLEADGGPSGLESLRWTLHADGTLELRYGYSLDGTFAYHGITFDHPDEQIASFRWLGEGPYRVWQNRLRGTAFGLFEHVRHVTQPGESWRYPEFEGYFAGARWVRFATPAGAFTIASPRGADFFRVGTPRISAATTTVDFPPGEISFVKAIPAIGSKGKPPERAGPQSQYAQAHGVYAGTLVFSFSE
jgi:hypothetical protein